MGTLVVSIVGGILCISKIIPAYWFIATVIASLVWAPIAMYLYFKFGFLKFYYHDFLGWHTPDKSPLKYDGCSVHATCKHCGKDIMQDSQGNWF